MNPLYHQAQFLISAPDLRSTPSDDGFEVAFAGRSNAGKSSAINCITRQKNLARTSKTPGRTQLLNFFSVTENTRLVDLPGYGYAKVPRAIKKDWHQMMENYLQMRNSLAGMVLVMDVRHPMSEFDQQMVDWCQTAGLPLHVLLTKADKLKRGAAANSLLKVRRMLQSAGVGITVQLFSSLKQQGVEEVHQVLDLWLGHHKEKDPDVKGENARA